MGDDRRVLAVDVGGTKTRLALFPLSGAEPSHEHTAASAEADGIEAILSEFLAMTDQPELAAACVGAAGPVVDGSVQVTNLAWDVEGEAVSRQLGVPVALRNDLEITALGMLELPDDRLSVLQQGARPRGAGPIAVVAAGTGYGEAVLIPGDAGPVPHGSETGHAGFAPRGGTERALQAFLEDRHGHVSIERVVSGSGLPSILAFLESRDGVGPNDPIAADALVASARSGDPRAGEALALFVSCYGAAAGDAALRHLALGGVLIGGGIAPRLRPEIESGAFLDAFLAKGHFRALLEKLHVAVSLEPDTALFGAAVLAQRLARR